MSKSKEERIAELETMIKVIGISTTHVLLMVDEIETISVDVENLEPIPITEELLQMYGFKKRIHSDKVFEYEKGVVSVVYYIEGSMCDMQGIYDGIIIMCCTHFHDLQNAYQLVTKEELTLQLCNEK